MSLSAWAGGPPCPPLAQKIDRLTLQAAASLAARPPLPTEQPAQAPARAGSAGYLLWALEGAR